MNKDKMAWNAYGSVICGENLWYTNYWGTQLCCFSLTEKKIKRIELIPYEGKRSALLYSNIVALKDDRLLLIPSSAYDVCIYNMADRTFQQIPLGVDEEAYSIFCGGVEWQNYVYLIPYNFRYIMRVDAQKGVLEKVCDLEEVADLSPKPTAFQYNYCVYDNRVFFLSAQENKVLAFNLDEQKVTTLSVGESDTIFTAIECVKGKYLVLIDQMGTLYHIEMDLSKWDRKEHLIEGYALKRNGHIVKSYADCKWINERLIFFPAHANKVLEYVPDMDKLNVIDFMPDRELVFDDILGAHSIKFSMVREYKGKLYGFYVKTRQIFEYDPMEQRFALYDTEIELDREENCYLMKQMIENGGVNEDVYSYASLETFIDTICRM